MSPKRPPGPSYRAVAGEVVGRSGRALPTPALALLRFYASEAGSQRRAGDRAAAACCAAMAVDLVDAILAADDWRRASGGEPAPDVAVLRRLARGLNPVADR